MAHGLEDGEREAFRQRGQHKEVRGGQQVRDVGAEPEEANLLRPELKLLCQMLDGKRSSPSPATNTVKGVKECLTSRSALSRQSWPFSLSIRATIYSYNAVIQS